jgi:5-carboxymethyl-2-hydroxymuconate isomerase
MALAVCLTVVMAAPVMAADVDFSGDYRVRGFYTSHWDLRETSASNAYLNMRFRLKSVFKASDILSVTTRFDALEDHVWGKADTQVAGGVNNVNFDHAYMTIKAWKRLCRL